jgi:hypothetical protein
MPIALETHLRLAKGQFRRMIQRVVPEDAEGTPLNVEILSGIHTGISGEIAEKSFSIGPANTNDLMLLDDEVLGDDVRFAVESSVFGPLLIVTTDRADIKINGTRVKPGAPCPPEPLPCKVDFNGVRLKLSAVGGHERPFMHKVEQTAMPLLVTVALVAFGTQVYLSSAPAAPFVLQPTIAADPAKKVAATASAEATIKGMIATAKLSDLLTVEKSGAGTISISGTLPPALMPKWQQIRSDIDDVAASAVIVSDVSETPPLTEMPPIAAVELGDDPAIILGDGKKLLVGEQIAGSWIIQSITENSIKIERDGETMDVTF